MTASEQQGRSVAEFITESVSNFAIGLIILAGALSEVHGDPKPSEKEKKAHQRKIDRIFWNG